MYVCYTKLLFYIFSYYLTKNYDSHRFYYDLIDILYTS